MVADVQAQLCVVGAPQTRADVNVVVSSIVSQWVGGFWNALDDLGLIELILFAIEEVSAGIRGNAILEPDVVLKDVFG